MSPDTDTSWVILSPHHDDAALSLGLTLMEAAQEGVALNILNVFTISEHAPGAGVQGIGDVSRIRAEEDAAFVGHLPGAVAGDLGRRDAPLRGYQGYGFIRRRDFDESERTEVLELALQLRRWSGHDAYYVPLGLGSHIDHRIARAAAERAWAGEAIRYYEDLPYAALKPGQLRGVLRSLGEAPELSVSGGTQRVEDKQELLDCYSSQLTIEHSKSVIAHARQYEGERWWRRSS